MSKIIIKQADGRILSFGELLLRIMPDTKGRWIEQKNLPFFIGGAELNVASALSLWGMPSAYLTALPLNNVSEQLISHLNEKGIDLSNVLYHGERIGLYFLNNGDDLKHGGAIYDRAHSAYADLHVGQINWEDALNGVGWLHFSAICPALSQNSADICLEALEVAKRKNVTISIDLNYRPKLWQYGKKPTQIMPQLARYADLLMGNLWAFNTMLDIPLSPGFKNAAVENKTAYMNEAESLSKEIIKQYPKCKVVANTFRFDTLNGLIYYSTLFTDDFLCVSTEYNALNIVNKVGSGDCYMAGLIYGFYNGMSAKEVLEFATAAGFTKLFVQGDATDKDVLEIQEAIQNEKK